MATKIYTIELPDELQEAISDMGLTSEDWLKLQLNQLTDLYEAGELKKTKNEQAFKNKIASVKNKAKVKKE